MRRLVDLGSLAEWAAAAAAAAAVLWGVSVWLGHQAPGAPGAAVADMAAAPPGVPPGAQSVPLLVLVDGTTIRVGDTQADIHAALGEQPHDPAPRVSRGAFGDRLTRVYERHGTRFVVVCERTEPGGPVRVARIYLPR